MKKLFALLCLFLFVLAAGCRTTASPEPIPGVPEVVPWRGIANDCMVDWAASTIVCDHGYFSVESRRCVDYFDAVLEFSRNWEWCEQRRALASDASASRLADCTTKLESPWRSPWLWGILGAIAAGAAGVGIGIKIEKDSD